MANPEIFDVEEGHVAALQGPGLGIEMNEALIREVSARHVEKYPAWRNPVWRGEDGSLREW